MKRSAIMLPLTAICAAAFATVVTPGIAQADPAPVLPTAFVTNVVDGDTIQLIDATRGQITVHLLGVDAPNVGECWAQESTDFARSSLQNQLVAVVGDPASPTADQFGQTLAYVVRIDGWNHSVESARSGAARAATNGAPLAKGGEITAVENEARKATRGLWGAACRPASAPVRQTAPAPLAAPAGVYFQNCDDARSKGAAPVLRGQPGYRAGLDRDNDGVGCEI